MQHTNSLRLKLSLYINYFVFAILLNSVGIVILKSQRVYGVDELAASTLELFKDLPIALVSFVTASFLPRIGYKNSMMIALALVSLACISMYFGNSFWSAKILFACVGAGFALIKVSVYSVIGLLTDNESEHNSLMSSVEGFFMFGIALAYFLFPAFNSAQNVDAWLNVYWLLAGLSMVSLVFLYFSKFDEGDAVPGANMLDDFKEMLQLMIRLLVLVFVISAFLFVMVEQGIMTWLPTFNNEVLSLSENIAIMMSSILAISLGVGRLIAGILARRFHWVWILSVCIIMAMLIVILVLPKAVSSELSPIERFVDIPLIGFVFPLVGLFIAPIYPLLNSVVLSALPQRLHSPMSGLIIIFSAIGGTLGSRLIGYLFKHVGGASAFYYLLIPMLALLASFIILNRLSKNLKNEGEVT
jgi:fucose permease